MLRMSKGNNKQRLTKNKKIHKELELFLLCTSDHQSRCLAIKLDNIHSTVSDIAQGVDSLEYNATEVDQYFVQLEYVRSSLQRDNEWLKTKVVDLEGQETPEYSFGGQG